MRLYIYHAPLYIDLLLIEVLFVTMSRVTVADGMLSDPVY